MIRVLFFSPFWKIVPRAYRSWFKIEKEGVKLDYFLAYWQPFGEDKPNENIAYKMNVGREMALKGGYDFLFNVDSDIILQKDALKLLLEDKQKVVSGIYRLRPSNAGGKPWAFIVLDRAEDGHTFSRPFDLEKDGKENPLVRLYQFGTGCCLISREILEKINFRPAPDTQFSVDLREMGIPFYADVRVKCVHIDITGEEIKP